VVNPYGRPIPANTPDPGCQPESVRGPASWAICRQPTALAARTIISAASGARLQRQVRCEDRRSDQQIDDSFLRFSQRKDNQYYQPDLPGPSGGARHGFIRALQQAASLGYTWTVSPTSLFEFRSLYAIVAGKNPP